MKKFLSLFALILIATAAYAQTDESVDKVRTQSGVDPTRVSTRASYSVMYYDKEADLAQINNRIAFNLGVNRWSFQLKSDFISTNGTADGGFKTGFGDLRFTFLNAFYVKGKNAFAGAVEFGLPTASSSIASATGQGSYFTATPSITWSYTINPGLMFAMQPQYTFDVAKNQEYPNLSVLTMRMFLAKFFKSGLFIVFEPRPVYDINNKNFDLIISPIFGKALGKGYNLLLLGEIPTKSSSFKSKGLMIQAGVSKNF